ncbi:TetR/AcrR family transcriptional regulator [Aeromicrobium fastidiosum]|uniref:TetR/AcrR family transcriptional regulator n=1 Tax=Aeromicrobium fastidiosum TaxID=52699 RepID=A0A641AL36_9ACTN|nr:TetR/AcrR family transcriptional regulator [Aeromicrobium fastidiosum]KAA1376551.1 TetR/AcrR family transcriptional regulator [Aeromicrobium fastidiosum]MBP2391529.1 AcrR family transcriptional regulator [Aeromicrobium fastidiosum]
MGRPRTISDDTVVSGLTATFRADGYAAASLSTLAQSSGLRSASLYHRFPDGKAGMALAVLAEVERRFTHVLEPLDAGASRSPASDVAEMARRLAEFYADGELACVLDTMTVGDAPAAVVARARALARAWVDAMAHASARAGSDTAQARRRALDAFVRVEGALVASRVLGDVTPFGDVVADLPDLLTRQDVP